MDRWRTAAHSPATACTTSMSALEAMTNGLEDTGHQNQRHLRNGRSVHSDLDKGSRGTGTGASSKHWNRCRGHEQRCQRDDAGESYAILATEAVSRSCGRGAHQRTEQ